jgi:phage terminase small subunit
MAKLTNEKHELFCHEFIKDLVGYLAYKRTFPKAKDSTAYRGGSDLLKRPEVKDRIDELLKSRYQKLKIDAHTVLQELLYLATSDMEKVFNDDGSLKTMKDIPKGTRRAISSVEIEELYDGHGEDRRQIGFTKKIKFWDKNKSLENLGKHLKLFTEVLEIDGDLKLSKLSDAELDEKFEALKSQLLK